MDDIYKITKLLNYILAINIISELYFDSITILTTLKVRKDGGEEIPLVQGKEQWLGFAGAAVKRYPTSKVRETQVRR